MKVLCLDQATYTTGYSIWEDGQLVAQGSFTYNQPTATARINSIKTRVSSMIDLEDIEKLYLEDIQYQEAAGITTYKILAELIGVLQDLAYEKCIPMELIHSQSWKSTCGIGGRTRAQQKANAQEHVKKVYNLDVSSDEADAICIGEHATRESECAW